VTIENIGLCIQCERGLASSRGPKKLFQQPVRGLSVEEHLGHLREDIIPLAERCGRAMREALGGLEALRALPSQAVERAGSIVISIIRESIDTRSPEADYT
jgi:hypothetical protein